jgi:hypothetical protein
LNELRTPTGSFAISLERVIKTWLVESIALAMLRDRL